MLWQSSRVLLQLAPNLNVCVCVCVCVCEARNDGSRRLSEAIEARSKFSPGHSKWYGMAPYNASIYPYPS